MDDAFRDFKAELETLPEDEQDAMRAEILAVDDQSSDNDDTRPPKGLRSPTSVMNAARKQFTDLVSMTGWSLLCLLIFSFSVVCVLRYGRHAHLRSHTIHWR